MKDNFGMHLASLYMKGGEDMRKLISIITCIAVAVAMLPAGAFAASKPSTPQITWTSSMDNMREGELIVKWTGQACSGWQMQVAKDAGFSKKMVYDYPGAYKEVTLKGQEKGVLEYVRIRGYNETSSARVYGSWSSTARAKIHAHALHEWVKEKPTVKKEGTRVTACYECGYTLTEKIPKLQQETKPTTKQQTKPTQKAKKTKKTATKPKKLTKAQRSAKARQAAVDWAKNIAEDNSFHYGKSSWAHHNGCYFCGTNQKKGSLKRRAGASKSACEKTYCCNPFVTAAYKHGAGAKEVNCKKSNKRFGLANDSNKVLKNKDAFKKISKPKKITALEPGDILLTPTHAMLYAGDGKVVEAAHHDNGKRGSYWNDSIRCKKISDRQWKRTTKIYRYIGVGRY